MHDHSQTIAILRRTGLCAPHEAPAVTALGGGVSCEVLRVDCAAGTVCVKRALPRLNVATLWEAPVARIFSEIAWIRTVAGIDPSWVPVIRHVEPEAFLFVMDFLDPADHPGWKPLLAEGAVGADFAASVGDALGRIHAVTAAAPELAARFDNAAFFHALRVDPYLLHTARAHPDRALVLEAIAADLGRRRIALMHGDVSPKNILKGPAGPVILDAECASWGDPAFDLAFCLNHLLLKAVWHREHARSYAAAFAALRAAYWPHVGWEDRGAFERRAAPLLAGLLLARIDGKSPVEYLTADRQKDFVRSAAREFLCAPGLDLGGLAERWYARIPAL